jgi:hypothetical protein
MYTTTYGKRFGRAMVVAMCILRRSESFVHAGCGAGAGSRPAADPRVSLRFVTLRSSRGRGSVLAISNFSLTKNTRMDTNSFCIRGFPASVSLMDNRAQDSTVRHDQCKRPTGLEMSRFVKASVSDVVLREQSSPDMGDDCFFVAYRRGSERRG